MTVRLTYEASNAGGPFDGDRGDAVWTAEAVDGGAPYAEHSGLTVLDAVMGLAQQLAGIVNAQRFGERAERGDSFDAQLEAAAAELTPEQSAALAASKARLAEKRAAAAAELEMPSS